MKHALCVACCCTLLAGSAEAGRSVRYALVVGNDFGRTPPGVVLPELKHAEEEATRLRERLVRLGNFDPSPERTVLLAGKSREAILQAARKVAEQHKADRAALGEVPTLFAFFFTGHGLSGQLLTATEPLTGPDLAAIFNEMGATFTVGVFDACFSGSLDLKALAAKGMTPMPGFNAFEALPQEVIDAQGTMWFVSSRPDQVSYEDERLGGVFTHFFMEAMERAPRAGFGVTLEEVWEYARAETQRYTSNATRPQTPQKLIRNLTSTGPLYFSFPSTRSAVLELEANVAGRFLLRYESGQLSELVVKEAGRPLTVPVYPTELVLERLGGGGQQHLVLRDRDAVRISDAQGWSAQGGLGSRHSMLAAKGERLEGLVLTREETAWSGLVDVGYQASWGPTKSEIPTHGLGAGFRLDRGLWQGRIGYALGHRAEELSTWSYSVQRHSLDLSLGPAMSWSRWRLAATLGASVAWNRVAFDDGERHTDLSWGMAARAEVLWRVLKGPMPLHLCLRTGLLAERSKPVAPADADEAWTLAPQLMLGIATELF
ncbi:MAG: caspase family protein [Deltaproteobacteria bacterium]|nr:caspase family protein [Deltaproteobacteria bacterium]